MLISVQVWLRHNGPGRMGGNSDMTAVTERDARIPVVPTGRVYEHLLSMAALLRVTGDVDVNLVSALRDAVDRAVRARPLVIVDLAGVRSIEALSLRTLGYGRSEARRHGSDLVLAAPSPVVRHTLRSVRLHLDFTIFAGVPQAMTAAAGGDPLRDGASP